MSEKRTLSAVIFSIMLAGTASANWKTNPYLLLGETLISSIDNLGRQVQHPPRFGEPVVDAAHDQNFQPWITVIRDPQSRRFRMWYNVPFTPRNEDASSLALIESEDGIHWIRPHKVL